MGHAFFNIVQKALWSSKIHFLSNKINHLCHPCSVAKIHRLPYTFSDSIYTMPLELIHSNLCGPSPVVSSNGYSYYVTFIDHFIHFTWLYLLKAKSEVSAVFNTSKPWLKINWTSKSSAYKVTGDESIRG